MATIPVRKTCIQERLLSETIAERRSTPTFDGTPIPDEALFKILQAGIESPSGYNLQPWRFIVVRDVELKKRLRVASMGQAKVEEAGAVIVCCGDLNATHGENLDRVLAGAAKHGFSEAQNQKVKQVVSKIFGAPTDAALHATPDYSVWITRQVTIAFTTMMWMAEALGFDTAPMEGFFEEKVKAVLNIPDHVRVVGLLCIGKRKGPDKNYPGRHEMSYVCFAEGWGNAINFQGLTAVEEWDGW